jgi:predicted acetyltransferase
VSVAAPAVQLVLPTPERLPGYVAALQRGWSPDNIRGAAAAKEALEMIAVDPSPIFAVADDPEARGPQITLPDGSRRERLPGLQRWLWDQEGDVEGFAGSINLRWMKGHGPLPSFVLGHVGYAVVPWKRQRGYATQALAQLLVLARGHGLPFVEITTDADNGPSQRVITHNGGVLIERFTKPAMYGGAASLRFRIELGA